MQRCYHGLIYKLSVLVVYFTYNIWNSISMIFAFVIPTRKLIYLINQIIIFYKINEQGLTLRDQTRLGKSYVELYVILTFPVLIEVWNMAFDLKMLYI